MFRLAHLSDMHLTQPGRPPRRLLLNKRLIGYLNWYRSRRTIHQRPVLDQVVADVHAAAADHIAVTGDLVNIGLPAEFEEALAWLESLAPPAQLSVVPGNHDAYVAVPYETGIGHWKAYMSGDATGIEFSPDLLGFPFVRLRGEIALIGLCSAVPTLPFMAAGRLGAAQLQALPPILDALGARGMCRIILVHHPPLPRPANWRRGLRDAAALGAVLLRHGVELVLYGHDHLQRVDFLDTDHGRAPVVCVPSASAGTLSGKVLAGYNLYEIARSDRRWSIAVERRGIRAPGAAMERIDRQVLIAA